MLDVGSEKTYQEDAMETGPPPDVEFQRQPIPQEMRGDSQGGTEVALRLRDERLGNLGKELTEEEDPPVEVDEYDLSEMGVFCGAVDGEPELEGEFPEEDDDDL